jgi:hypothetical protein
LNPPSPPQVQSPPQPVSYPNAPSYGYPLPAYPPYGLPAGYYSPQSAQFAAQFNYLGYKPGYGSFPGRSSYPPSLTGSSHPNIAYSDDLAQQELKTQAYVHAPGQVTGLHSQPPYSSFFLPSEQVSKSSPPCNRFSFKYPIQVTLSPTSISGFQL